MWTTCYKGYFIHGYCNRDECRASIDGHKLTTFRSLLAAKQAISKSIAARKAA